MPLLTRRVRQSARHSGQRHASRSRLASVGSRARVRPAQGPSEWASWRSPSPASSRSRAAALPCPPCPSATSPPARSEGSADLHHHRHHTRPRRRPAAPRRHPPDQDPRRRAVPDRREHRLRGLRRSHPGDLRARRLPLPLRLQSHDPARRNRSRRRRLIQRRRRAPVERLRLVRRHLRTSPSRLALHLLAIGMGVATTGRCDELGVPNGDPARRRSRPGGRREGGPCP
jgi:hypothetical protein